jgi:hypothetical protein
MLNNCNNYVTQYYNVINKNKIARKQPAKVLQGCGYCVADPAVISNADCFNYGYDLVLNRPTVLYTRHACTLGFFTRWHVANKKWGCYWRLDTWFKCTCYIGDTNAIMLEYTTNFTWENTLIYTRRPFPRGFQ